jgi:hypothetical protein
MGQNIVDLLMGDVTFFFTHLEDFDDVGRFRLGLGFNDIRSL